MTPDSEGPQSVPSPSAVPRAATPRCTCRALRPNSSYSDIFLLHGSFGRLASDPTFVLGVIAISGGAILPQLGLKIFGFYFKPAAHQVGPRGRDCTVIAP